MGRRSDIGMLVGVDPGDSQSGVAILRDGHLICAFNVDNQYLINKLTTFFEHAKCHVVIEDVKGAYRGLSVHLAETLKFIGELRYRLRIESGVTVQEIPRTEIRKWLFDTYPEACKPLVAAKMRKKLASACDLKTREEILVDAGGRRRNKESHVYVDDRIVQGVMKAVWKLEKEPGRKSWPYGLSSHGWQALAVATMGKSVCQGAKDTEGNAATPCGA